MQQVRVFIVPRTAARGGKVTTALRLAMDDAGVGCHRLEVATEVSHSTIGKLANGTGGVERGKAERIADALERQVGALFVHKDGADVVGA